MKQPSLFTSDDTAMTAVRFHPSHAGWQTAARRLLLDKVMPQSIHWIEDGSLSAAAPSAPSTRRMNASFKTQAAAASCYRAADRWALLYRVAWRLTFEQPHLLDLAGDADVQILARYAKAVRRDAHKMTAFVRFRAVQKSEQPEQPDQPTRFVAWFEPDHLIVEYTAPFFRKRFANMPWSILTPDRCVHYAGEGTTWFTDGAQKSDAPDGDSFEAAWRTYYKHIFNPARLKLQAMRSEMPQKYWKNLPEAADIGRLVLDADRRVRSMQHRRKSEDVLQCGPRPQSQTALLSRQHASLPEHSLARLRVAAQGCQECPLAEHATQVVFGEGPEGARVMLIGEQPGAEEDLSGRPFVGPAGQLLDSALQAVGLDRRQLYITNSVKHFKFKAVGKRRLHQTPNAQEVFACGVWLESEIALVDPEVIVCLGLTAAQHLLNTQSSLRMLRADTHFVDGRRVIPTLHPASVLRLTEPRAADTAFASLVSDLLSVTLEQP